MLEHMPDRIELAHLPSPMRELKNVNAAFPGKRLWLKQDELTGLALSGNKVRKLEFLLADALRKSCHTVLTCGGIQSNHCRATAFACAQLGLKCSLILRDDRDAAGRSSFGEANHFLSMLAGANIELLSSRDYVKQLTERFDSKIKHAAGGLYAIPTGGSNGIGLWGYVLAAKEILEQCQQLGFSPDLVVCASGSGGTQAGLSLGFHSLNRATKVLGFAVCDSAHYFVEKIEADIRHAGELAAVAETEVQQLLAELDIAVNDDYIGPGYARAYPELYQRIIELARNEGLVLDPVYTGKAMHGLLSELEAGRLSRYDNIVFVHTGGAFGLFAQASALINAAGTA
ncbi:D-cysteine desulfhydrase family protein [Agaribacterium haliotis]|uniref:D-cysteine desulfhydrase family protein n=1 Tax=Agaribacterium haliotis TaxID=2013869 RepID=UPI000BB5615C|nr:D-cysteine desulfhydrase family protein [Agaribacterium haliotis]